MDLLKLAKIPLSLLIALTALFGFVLQSPRKTGSALLCFLAVFLLAAGCATLNNVQDRLFDLRLKRTRDRPLPAGRIGNTAALVQATILISLGLTGITIGAPAPALYAGIASIILYNGIYTPLKAKTILAIVPGTVCGMMPPLIGWLVAGGRYLSPDIISAMLIIGVWQLPHFWLIMLFHGEDYETKGPPSMLNFFSSKQILRITLLWVLVFAFLTLFLPFFHIVSSQFGKSILLGNAFILCSSFAYVCYNQNNLTVKLYRHLFIHLNSALLIVILVGIADNLA